MDRHIRLLGLMALAAAILNSTLASAQAPPTPKAPVAPKSEQLDPKACADQTDTVGQGGDVHRSDGKSLSDRLARSDGVICPPSHIDPEITQPAPEGGRMPVIPPPGSPGGDPTVRPK
jgi:hypothetical protein